MNLRSLRKPWGIALSVLLLAGVSWAQDSLNVSQVAKFDYWSATNQAVVSGHYAYVAAAGSGLIVVDIENQANPRIVGHYQKDYGSANGVAVIGDYAFLGYGCWGFRVVDVHDPVHPREVANLPNGCAGIVANGNYLYVNGTEGCGGAIIDVSDPLHPALIADNWLFDSQAACSGSYLLGDGWDELSNTYLKIVSIADPGVPVSVSMTPVPSMVKDVAVSGDYAYLADWSAGLRVMDISDPASPHEVAHLNTPANAATVDVSGTLAFVGCDNGRLIVADITNPEQPSEIGSAEVNSSISSAEVTGDYVYVTGTAGRAVMAMVDYRVPDDPTVVGVAEAGGFLQGAVIEGSHAYLATGGGLSILSVPDAQHVSEVGFLPMMEADFVAVAGNFAFTASPFGNFGVVNVSDPSHPLLLAQVPDLQYAYGVYSSGQYAYVLEDDLGAYLRTFDISDPANPQSGVRWQIAGFSGHGGWTQRGEYLYVVGGSYNLGVVRLNNDGYAQLLGQCELGQQSFSVAANNSYAFAACQDDSIRVVDVTEPSSPSLMGTWPVLLEADAIGASSDHAYVHTRDGRLHFYDITDVLHPVEDGYYDRPNSGIPGHILNNGSLTLVQSEFSVAVYEHTSNPQAVQPSERMVSTFSLSSCYPNPFNPTTTVRFSLAKSGPASLIVYDITGRQVRALTQGVLAAGEHVAEFDGTNLASGVYFCSLVAGRESSVRKMILMK